MKKQSRSIKKQARREQDKRRRKEAERKHRQAAERAEAQLWEELEPLTHGYNMDDDDDFIEFASHVMFDSAALYDEPEFKDLTFDPAEAMLAELGSFNATVPAPEKLDQMPDEEHQDVLEDAQVRAVTALVTPSLQRDLLKRLKACRQRFKHERKTDQLALASALEMLFRNDSRSLIWATCGILHKAFGAALATAFEFQGAEDEALKIAQVIQPDITETVDLVEGSPAFLAFWETADKTPGLAEYLERTQELGATAFEMQHELNAELGMELFDPEEIEDLVHALAESMKAQGVDLDRQPHEQSKSPISESTFAEVIKAKISTVRFQELLDDLDNFAKSDEMDELARRALLLRDDFGESDLPYWENHAFQQLCLDVMVADVLDSTEEGQDDEDA